MSSTTVTVSAKSWARCTQLAVRGLVVRLSRSSQKSTAGADTTATPKRL